MARTPALGSNDAIALTLTAVVLVIACGKEPPPEPAKTPDPTGDSTPGKLGEPVIAKGAATPGTTEVAPPPKPQGEPVEPDGSPSPDEEGAPAAADEKAAAPDPQALLKEVKSKRTKDDRALAALAEAEAAGTSPRDLAKAANSRGLALHASPDRAKQFFEWAAEKDPKYAEPLFNIAKQYAMTGDIPMIKEYLVKTKERGGKKLLSQIEFDPTWQIVADDPEVRKLLK